VSYNLQKKEKLPDAPDQQMLETALLGEDAAPCHLLASKVANGESLNSFKVDEDLDEPRKGRVSGSAPGKLENASCSADSSWRCAARALQDVEATSQVTEEQWPAPQSSLDMHSIMHSPAALSTAVVSENPAKPPGVFEPVVDGVPSGTAAAATTAPGQGSKKTKNRNRRRHGGDDHSNRNAMD